MLIVVGKWKIVGKIMYYVVGITLVGNEVKIDFCVENEKTSWKEVR